MILETEDVYIKNYVISESTVHCLLGWLKMVPQNKLRVFLEMWRWHQTRFIAVSFVIIYIDLMRNQPFWTLPVAIFRQYCINNQNIHNTNNHVSIVCTWWYVELQASKKLNKGQKTPWICVK